MEITAMASSTTPRPSLPTPSPHTVVTTFHKPQLRRSHLATSTTISLLALFAPPNEAKAAVTIAKDQIVSSLTQVEKTIDQVQEVGSSFLDTARRVAEVIGNALKPGIETALPIVQQAGEEAFKIASPAISEASKKAQEALQSSGVDTQPVITAAKTVADAAQQTSKAIEVAKPIASSTVETISSSDPTVIAGTAGALLVAYLLFPPIWSAISSNLRGYKGDLTPAQTLDLISTQNYVLIDIRSEKDKDKAGIPRLPSSAKNRMVAIPLEELPSKLKGQVKNVKKLEAEIVALKISYLKKINKGTDIVILDSYSDVAKIVGRSLTSLGFKNTWIVADGFSGNKGWLQSRLGTDSSLREHTVKLTTFRNDSFRTRCAVDTPFGGNVQKFPRINVWDPYRRLGVSHDAAEEEIWGSRNFLLQQYAGHERSEESIEAAFEKILMASFIQRKKTKINLKSKLKKKVEESPPWVKNLLNFVELPPTDIILRRLFLFGFMGGWSIMNSAETGPAFQIWSSSGWMGFWFNAGTQHSFYVAAPYLDT
ncbi:Calcium sensing receptor, chloroplastic [Mucuna pruriens]|uniref:Calcium sensing receptor, chloroplastic n=1 Tax=Mucuna pruriens TaxID=157652 RepID=A0A371HUZ2_MUCPR|nr:Calcium sensing receptor, chloroplastic [Mucuna pruriens]